jgi:CheY-like chemotaxis protein
VPKLTGLCSHINQQIALKTIKKLHFSVQAVWNGKEALDYLSEDFSAEHPRPDLILMDVSKRFGANINCNH